MPKKMHYAKEVLLKIGRSSIHWSVCRFGYNGFAESKIERRNRGKWRAAAGKFLDHGVSDSAAIICMAIDPSTLQTIYAGTLGGGIDKSTDAGAAWTAVSSGLSNLGHPGFIDPSTPQTNYAGTHNGTFKSINGGAAWIRAQCN